MNRPADEIAALVDALSGEAKRELNYLLTNYLRFVEEVERGYRLNIYDYCESIHRRESLEEVIEKTALPLRLHLRAFVEQMDERYRAATTEVSKTVMPQEWDPLRWWSYRIPKILLPELSLDLRRQGILR